MALGVLIAGAAPRSPFAAPAPVPVDSRIAAMVGAVSRADVRRFDTALVGFGTRNDFSEQLNSKARGVFAARDWIRAQFEKDARRSGGRMSVALDTYLQPKTPRTPRAVTESSVIATLRGDSPGPTYVMSSHYDDCNGDCTDGLHDAPGADDNGSATSAVLEAAKVMSPVHFRGTIIFAAFDGEELGLWGSDHFARELKAQHADVVADLNNDIIGSSIGRNGARVSDVRLFSESLPDDAQVRIVNALGSENDSPSRELARFVASVAERYVPSPSITQIYRADRFLRGGDQESFTAQGFPAVRFVEGFETFAHQHQNVGVRNGIQYGDLLEYIDFAYLAKVTRMDVAALATLALGPDQPAAVQMLTRHLSNDTELRWKPASGASRYEIVWRSTTAPQWQYAKNVGTATEATVPVSKDDYIFGVRSIDARGLPSPAVYPVPVRQ